MPWFNWDLSRETGEDVWEFGPKPEEEEDSTESEEETE